jgi:hypothetical protein
MDRGPVLQVGLISMHNLYVSDPTAPNKTDMGKAGLCREPETAAWDVKK